MSRGLLIAIATAWAAGCGPTSYKITPVPADRTLEETVLIDEGGWAPAKIALVDLTGLILDAPEPKLLGEGEHPVSFLVEKLNKAAQDSSVRAIVLRINSPGGSVTASDIMYQEVLRVRRTIPHPKPVIAMVTDMAASGGYYVACACDEIVAYRTSVVGSIGVIMQTFNFKGTLDKIGVQTLAIKSGAMKDAGSPFRPLTDAEKERFQTIIDDFFDRFVEVVSDGRPRLDAAQVRALADGRVWTAKEALDLGLVDRIGTLRDSIAAAKQRIGAKNVRVVTYHRPLDWKPNIYAEAPTGVTNNYGLNVTVPGGLFDPSPRFLYLWMPGS